MRVTDEMVEQALAEWLKITSPTNVYRMRAALEAAVGSVPDPPDPMEATVRDLRDRADKSVRDALVSQTRTLVQMTNTLSDSLGACVALLAAIDENGTDALPPLASILAEGRVVIQAWQEAKPHINQGLDAVGDG